MSPAKASWLAPKLWQSAAAILILFAIYLLFTGLSTYNDSYDPGVYLESARMMGRGYPLYQQIFDSQPPLWLPLIHASFRLFGESVLAGQLVSAIAGLITIVAVMLTAKRLGGNGGAILAGFLITLSPLELRWSRTLDADVPSAALAAISMACAAGYARKGRRQWLVAAAAAAICSILIKLSGVYAVPALGLFVIARGKLPQAPGQRRKLWFVAQDTLIIGAVFAGITLLSLALLRSDQVWNQAVTFHWIARSAYAPLPLDQRWHLLFEYLASEPLLLIAAPLAGLCLLNGIDGLAIFAWPAVTFIGLLVHHPLYDHHVAALIPALAAAIGVGAGNLGRIYVPFVRWLSVRSRPTRIVARAAAVAAGLAIVGAIVSQTWIEAARQQAFIRSAGLPGPDSRVVDLIVAHTRPGDMIITDDQGLAFLAARDVPPDLTDTSIARIICGYLQPREVIDQGERYHVRLILLWTGRLGMMPEVVQWAENRFPVRIEVGAGRTIYIR
ncbi:MAG TPA: glycosyltransferase family 39 protein [Candidatus Binataceae bacterium]|nr:glycosyltransferase family 39 protein [Candidatus Binataceae bacterium]